MTKNTELTTDRRAEIARDALNTGMDDPYWLYNFSRNTRYSSTNDDILEVAEELREDAELLETALSRVEDDGWTPAEAALWVAERANFGEYDTDDYLYDNIPIQGRE